MLARSLPPTHWHRKGILYGPTATQSSQDRLVIDAGRVGPGRQWLCHPLERQHPIPPHVPALFLLCRPPTVAGFIATVTVDPVNAMGIGGTWSHVFQELLERLPALADRDAATAVVRPRDVGRVRAATQHGGPGAVLRATASSMGDGLSSQLLMPAPARLRSAAPEIRGRGRMVVTAVTSKAPANMAVGTPRVYPQNKQAAEPHAGHDGKLRWHRDLPLSRNRGARPGLLTQDRGTLRCNFTTQRVSWIAQQPSLPDPPSWLYERVPGPTEDQSGQRRRATDRPESKP